MAVGMAQPRHYDGIDVSHYQGVIDWKQVKQDSLIQFVYIKATEGKTFRDPRYKRNIREARKQGLKVGSYHFFHMSSSAREQFNNYKKMVKKSEQDLIPMIDVELACSKKRGCFLDNYNAGNEKHREAMVKRLRELADLMEEYYGCRPIIYCALPSYGSIIKGNFDDYPLYVGNYRDKKVKIKNCYIWQYSSNGCVRGISSENNNPKVCDIAAFYNGCRLADITIGTAKTPNEKKAAKLRRSSAKPKVPRKSEGTKSKHSS